MNEVMAGYSNTPLTPRGMLIKLSKLDSGNKREGEAMYEVSEMDWVKEQKSCSIDT